MVRGAARDTLIAAALASRRRFAGGSDLPSVALQSLARDVARELTPPLTTLWSRIEVMIAEARSDLPPTDIVGDLETLVCHAERIASTVKGLLCLGGIQSSDERPVDANGVVEDSLAALIPRLARQGVVVRPRFDRALPSVQADAEALKFVLTRLVEIVAQISTTVEVATRRAEDGTVRVDVGTDGETAGLRVLDPCDPFALTLIDAIVRDVGGSLERRDGNPAAAFSVSLRVAPRPPKA